MLPAEFRAARKALDHTQHTMAAALSMGKHGWQTVSKWERGVWPIPGPVRVAVTMMLENAERTDET